jgi:hypothetical protein
MYNPEDIIKRLNLKPHPKEGGFFVETYRSNDLIYNESLSDVYNGERSYSTCIYYLLTPNTFSEMHRLLSDEIFHFYLGDPVEMLQLNPDGSGKRIVLGHDILNGMEVQVIVLKNTWQGARLIDGGKFALMGTTVAPGFELSDYESGNRSRLIAGYPNYKELITKLTK